MKHSKKYYWADTGLRGYDPPSSKRFATVKGAWNHIVREFNNCFGGKRLVTLYTDAPTEFIHGKQQFPTDIYGHKNYEPFEHKIAVCCGMSHLDYDGKEWAEE